MDIYEYLKKDHQKVSKLFKQFSNANTAKQRLEIFGMIQEELLLHAESEQNTFYKALETHAEYKKEVFHAEDEHAEIKNKIEEIVSVNRINSAWVEKVMKLKELVEHHVEEEEGKMFDEAKKVFSEEDAMVLKERMHDLKEKILEQAELG